VEAFEQTEVGWKLVLAGSAGYGSAEISARISSSPRRNDIQVLGYVSDPQLARWYARARIFAFPSLDEGFGMPVLDAMARGVPVLTSNKSALPEVAGNAALLVEPASVDSIEAGLKRLMEDEALRAELSNKGIERARQFSWGKAVEETWRVYGELLGG